MFILIIYFKVNLIKLLVNFVPNFKCIYIKKDMTNTNNDKSNA